MAQFPTEYLKPVKVEKAPVKEEKLTINYAFQKTVSYSQFLSYNTCPHQWYVQYGLKNYDFKPSIHLIFGTSIHETLQEYFNTMYNVSGKKADELDVEAIFKEKYINEYKKRLDEAKGEHFSDPDEMKEFFEDGLNIISFVKKRRSKYFSLRNMELVGIEIPLLIQANTEISNVFFKGSIDFVVRDKVYNKYTIYDIKTSTRGWSANDKRDPGKINQVLLYKKYFSRMKGVPEEDIDVKFFVVKRKLPKVQDFAISRIQEFTPASGRIKMRKATEEFNNFLLNVFTKTGEIQHKDYEKNISGCKYCPFRNKPELCDKGTSNTEKKVNTFFVDE